jgi:drug/metabolite transporter (DMT)-like permease
MAGAVEAEETVPASAWWKTHAALLVVQVAFASQAVEGKIAMMPHAAGGEQIAPTAIAMARMLGAAVFFQLFARTTARLERTTSRDHAILAILSVLGIALNQALFLIGLRSTTPNSAALLCITIPVFTAALAVLFRQERPSLRTGLGLLCAASGVVWLTGIGSVDFGAIVISVNCLVYAAYIVLSRRVIVRLGALTVITWIFTWGALLFAPFGARDLLVSVPTWTSRGWAFIAYIVVVPTIVAYLANAWALGRSNASLVTVYIYVQPTITALLGYAQLGQTLSSRVLVAAPFIALGVAIVATRGHVRRTRAREAALTR